MSLLSRSKDKTAGGKQILINMLLSNNYLYNNNILDTDKNSNISGKPSDISSVQAEIPSGYSTPITYYIYTHSFLNL